MFPPVAVILNHHLFLSPRHRGRSPLASLRVRRRRAAAHMTSAERRRAGALHLQILQSLYNFHTSTRLHRGSPRSRRRDGGSHCRHWTGRGANLLILVGETTASGCRFSINCIFRIMVFSVHIHVYILYIYIYIYTYTYTTGRTGAYLCSGRGRRVTEDICVE